MNAPVRISVIMPVYNAQRYLATAMESILAQTFSDFELIAVDDGSTDQSLEILRQHAQKDRRIQIISRPNTGIVGALNDGLAVAKGEFIARMDADDISYRERFAIQLRFLESHPEIVAIGSAVRMVDPKGIPLKNFNAVTDSDQLREQLIDAQDIGIIHPTLMARRSVLAQVNGYRKEYNFVEDLDLFFRLLDLGELGNVEDVLLDYRQHSESTNWSRHEKQSALHKQCIAEHRNRRNLPPLETTSKRSSPMAPGMQHVQWAYWAMEGGNLRTALRHAIIGCVLSGLAPEPRKCFNYIIRTLWNR